MEKFFDLSFSRQPDGSVLLLQSDFGEDSSIFAHPEQLLYVARCLGGMKPETAGKVAELERRIAVMADKLQDLVCDTDFRSNLINGCEFGFAHMTQLDALLDLAMEFDKGRLKPNDQGEAPATDRPDFQLTPSPVVVKP